MGSLRRLPMTGDEFLAWEERQELRWEFDGVAPRAMVGGTLAHDVVQGNLFARLHAVLLGSRCRPHGAGLKVATGEGRYRYPDGFVRCGPAPPTTTIVDDPVVIFEVISKGTEHVDRADKLDEYRSIPSVQRYVLIEQDEVLVTVVTRRPGLWSIETLRAGATLDMPEIEAGVAIDDLYLDVEFPPVPENEGF